MFLFVNQVVVFWNSSIDHDNSGLFFVAELVIWQYIQECVKRVVWLVGGVSLQVRKRLPRCQQGISLYYKTYQQLPEYQLSLAQELRLVKQAWQSPPGTTPEFAGSDILSSFAVGR